MTKQPPNLGDPRSLAVPAFFLYGEAPRPPDDATVHVETIAARSRLHEWKIQPHRHRDLHQILLVRTGLVTAALDEHTARVCGPGVVVVPPGTVHGFQFDEDTLGLVISFAGGLARDLAGHGAGLNRFLDRPVAVTLTKATFAAMDVARLSGMLLREFERSALGRECALRGLLGALIANVYRVAHRAAAASGAVGHAHQLVALGFEDPAYFTRFFRRGSGVSPKAFRARGTGAPGELFAR